MQELTTTEFALLVDACAKVPPAKNDYRIHDFVENLLLTVVDFQMQTTAVERAHSHFKENVQIDASDLVGLKTVLERYPDNKEGNIELALCLWGYRLWTRAGMLRRLVEFFEAQGVTDQSSLSEWAFRADFKKDFEGKVKGLGYAIFNWLVMRQGVETIKPDVHTLRFVENTIGWSVKDTVAVEALIRVAKELGIPAFKLDWAIWEQGRAKK